MTLKIIRWHIRLPATTLNDPPPSRVCTPLLLLSGPPPCRWTRADATHSGISRRYGWSCCHHARQPARECAAPLGCAVSLARTAACACPSLRKPFAVSATPGARLIMTIIPLFMRPWKLIRPIKLARTFGCLLPQQCCVLSLRAAAEPTKTHLSRPSS